MNKDSVIETLARGAISDLLTELFREGVKRLIEQADNVQYFSEKFVISFLDDQGFELVCAERAETNLEALRKKKGGIGSLVYNQALYGIFFMARLLRRQNKLVIVVRKHG